MQPSDRRRGPDPTRERARRIANIWALSEIPSTPWWQRPDAEPLDSPTSLAATLTPAVPAKPAKPGIVIPFVPLRRLAA